MDSVPEVPGAGDRLARAWSASPAIYLLLGLLLLSLLAGCVAPGAVQQPAGADSAPVLTVHASRT